MVKVGGRLIATAVVLILGPFATAASADTPVTASPSTVRQEVFAAGAGAQLFPTPSPYDTSTSPGPLNLVLNRILERTYESDPTMPASQADADITSLRNAWASVAPAAQPFADEAANEQFISVLNALESALPSDAMGAALQEVAQQTLADSANAAFDANTASGETSTFAPNAAAGNTLTTTDFDPRQILVDAFHMAAGNAGFAAAWDGAFASAAGETITTSLPFLEANPALKGAQAKQVLALIDAGGRVATNLTTLTNLSSDSLSAMEGVIKYVSQNAGTQEGHAQYVTNQNAIRDAEAAMHMTAGFVSLGAPYDGDNLSMAGLDMGLIASSSNNWEYSATAALKFVGSYVGFVASIYTENVAGAITNVINGFNALSDLEGGGQPTSPTQVISQQLAAVQQDLLAFETKTSAYLQRIDQNLITAYKSLSTQISDLSQYLVQNVESIETNLQSVYTVVTQIATSLDQMQSSIYAISGDSDLESLWTNIHSGIDYQDFFGPHELQNFAAEESSFNTFATATSSDSTAEPVPNDFSPTGVDARMIHQALPYNAEYLNELPAALPQKLSWLAGSQKIPNPQWFSVSAQALGELLAENPDQVTAGTLSDLQATLGMGTTLQNAIGKLSAQDVSGTGTGNSYWNALLAYEKSWFNPGASPLNCANGADNGTTVFDVLSCAEQHYMSTLTGASSCTSNPCNLSSLNLWGGPEQAPPVTSLPSNQGCGSLSLPANLALATAVHNAFVDAFEFDGGTLTKTCSPSFVPGTTSSQTSCPQPGHCITLYSGQLTMTIAWTYTEPPAPVGDGQTHPIISATVTGKKYLYCTQTGGGSECGATPDGYAYQAAINAWTEANWDGDGDNLSLQTEFANASVTDGGSTSAIEALVNTYLLGKQKDLYTQLLNGGKEADHATPLPEGDLNANPSLLNTAAQSMDGAAGLLAQYAALGLEPGLASDDLLHSLLFGAGATQDTQGNITTSALLRFGDLITFYNTAITNPPATDELGLIMAAGNNAEGQLASELTTIISDAANGTQPETNPFVQASLDRLELTKSVATWYQNQQQLGKTVGEISGKVTNSASTPVPLEGICVSAVNVATGKVASTTISGRISPDGAYNYMLAGLPTGPYAAPIAYYIRFSDCTGTNYLAQTYSDNGTAQSPVTIVPCDQPGEPTSTACGVRTAGINISLTQGGGITGTVSDTAAAALEAICVTATSGGKVAGPTATASDGTYTLPSLAAGSYTVQFTDCRRGAYVSRFGAPGTAGGDLSAPEDSAVDPATGDVYVVDSGNQRVEKFGPGGTYLATVGGPGTGSGQFSRPAGVAVDAAGNLYVVDAPNDRVEVFNSSGTFVSQFGAPGTGAGQFSDPTGVAVGPSGAVYVVDSGNNRVEQFTSAGVFSNQFGVTGSGAGQFEDPTQIAIDPGTGEVFVVDSINDRVEKFTAGGTYESAFGSAGSGNGHFTAPAGIGIDPMTHQVWVADSSLDVVQAFTPAGTYVTQFGGPGLANGEFGTATGVSINGADGNIYVSDAKNDHVQRFDPGGSFSTQYYNGQATAATANPVAVTAGPSVTGINAALALAGGISGVVSSAGSNPAPLPDICVEVQTTSGAAVITQRTASDGSYDIPGLAPGAYDELFTDCSGHNYVSQYYAGAASRGSATPITVNAGRTTASIDAQLAQGGEIDGTVTDTSNTPLAGICVQADDAGTGATAELIHSSSSGAYRLTSLPVGSYIVSFSDCLGHVYVNQYYNGAASKSAATDVPVTAGGTTTGINAALAAGGSITGTVTNSSNAGIAGICVTARTPGTGAPLVATQTGASGTYTLTSVPTGSVVVRFGPCSGTAWKIQYYNNQATLASANQITVTARGTVGSVNATLQPGPAPPRNHPARARSGPRRRL